MSWLAVALWGGAVGLDGTSFPQAMISRPLVAGSITGLLLGHPIAGAAIGVILELFALVILPIGAARYPEAGTGAVAAAAAYVIVAGGEQQPGLLLLAVGFGLIWERLGGASVNALRRMNERRVAAAMGDRAFTAGRLEWLHLTALGIDFIRGSAVSTVGALVAALLLRSVGGAWAVGAGPTSGALGIATAAMIGAALSLFDGWSEHRFAFVLGVLCGLMLLLVG